jgi:hypothetical protein
LAVSDTPTAKPAAPFLGTSKISIGDFSQEFGFLTGDAATRGGTEGPEARYRVEGAPIRQDDRLNHIRALRDRADEVRAVASSIHDKECRAVLVRRADSYESMVEAVQKAYVTGRELK